MWSHMVWATTQVAFPTLLPWCLCLLAFLWLAWWMPNVTHLWTSSESQTQNLAVHMHSHLQSPCSGQSGVPCLVSVPRSDSRHFWYASLNSPQASWSRKPSSKDFPNSQAPPTFVVLPSIWPRTSQAAADADEEEILLPSLPSWAHIHSLKTSTSFIRDCSMGFCGDKILRKSK